LGTTEKLEEGFSELSNKPIDGKVDRSVHHLEQLDKHHGVHKPDGSDALTKHIKSHFNLICIYLLDALAVNHLVNHGSFIDGQTEP
jgi:hypothetical protein